MRLSICAAICPYCIASCGKKKKKIPWENHFNSQNLSLPLTLVLCVIILLKCFPLLFVIGNDMTLPRQSSIILVLVLFTDWTFEIDLLLVIGFIARYKRWYTFRSCHFYHEILDTSYKRLHPQVPLSFSTIFWFLY